jgi:hypothetical protein
MIQAKFGLNWPSGFRGEDFWKSLQTDDRRQVKAIAHTGIDLMDSNLWFFNNNTIFESLLKHSKSLKSLEPLPERFTMKNNVTLTQ